MNVLIAAGETKASVIRTLLPRGELTEGVHTVNQLLESLARGEYDRVIVDPDWVETGWWKGIFRAVSSAGSQLWFLYEAMTGYEILRLDPVPQNLTHAVLATKCWEIAPGGRDIVHCGRTLHFGRRTQAVLHVLSGATPGYLWTPEAINRALTQNNIPPLSNDALTVHVHTLRKGLGEDHILTERRLGYRWNPCPGGLGVRNDAKTARD